MIKYSMFALLLWLGVAMLSAGAEYVWIEDSSAAAITRLWNGWNIVGTIIGAGGIITTIIAGSRGLRIVTLVATVVVLIALRDIMTFNFPTVFYGPYEVVRWVILLVIVAIFIIPIMMSLITRSTSD